MKKSPIRQGLSTGVPFGLVLLFIFLIGFTTTAADLVGKIIGMPAPPNGIPPMPDMVVFIVLMGLLCGSTASKNIETGRWGHAALAGLAAGIIEGLIASIAGLIFGILIGSGTDIRTYLISLSPDTIRLFLFQLGVPAGPLALLAVLALSGLCGGLLGSWVRWSGAVKSAGGRMVGRVVSLTHSQRLAAWSQDRKVRLGALLVFALAMIFLPRIWGSYWNYVLGTVGIYILLGIGLNIITGWAGQLVIGYVAFFAIGAYTFAILTAPEPHHLQWNFWIALLMGVIAAAIAGVLLGLPTLSLRGDYLAIVTLGFAEIVRILINSDMLTSFTGGPKGMRDIGGPTLFGMSLASDVDFMYLILVAVLVIIFIAYRLQYTRTGRGWVAIREDETVARATGINAYASKLLALAISAGIAGLAGALFASRNQFIGPNDNTLMVAINVICLVIVGGIGSIPGIILGAFALKGLPEILREIENYRMLVFGALLVVMMNLRPEGFLPATRPNLEKSGKAGETQPAQAAPEPGTD
jgi:ABC-type branched-subunit amino acid transport system permease subunit